MNSGTDCDRVRLHLMAALDGEAVREMTDAVTDSRRHLALCSACRGWLKDLESINSRFERVTYPGAQVDLWASVECRIRHSHTRLTVTQRIWLIGALVLTWRTLELLIDLPFPVLHPLVPLAAAVAALWQMAGDPLAIETFAPELQKRGV